MNKHEKVNDSVTRVLEYYKLREPVDCDTLMYLKKRETEIFKNVLKKAGKYTVWLGMIYSFMNLLPKIGIQVTFNKAVAALITTVLVGTSGVAYGVYQAAPVVIDLLHPEKTQIENIQKPKQMTDEATVKPAEVNRVASPKHIKQTGPLPEIGILKLESYVPGIKPMQVTRRFLAQLPKNKFQFLRSANDDNSHLNYFSEIFLVKTKTGYEFSIRVLNGKRKYSYGKTYAFKHLSELDSILMQAAKELTNANL